MRWTVEQIIDYYDSNLNVTLRELSIMSGFSVPELKRILMGER